MNNKTDILIKMLIVDDEQLIRDGLRKFVDWSTLGIEIIGDVGNVCDALKFVEENVPDLILTDIRMPEISGLELVDILKKKIPECLFVILSGYDDFDYARHAISAGVEHYIVKPLERNELVAVMGKCVKKIRMMELRKLEEEGLREKLNKAVPMMRDGFMLNILKGAVRWDINELQYLNVNIINKFYVVTSVKLVNTSNLPVSFKNFIILKEKLLEIIEKLSIENIKYYCLVDMDNVKLLVSMQDRIDYKNLLKDILLNLNTELMTYYNMEAICGTGSLVENPEEIAASSSEADRVLEYKQLKCNEDILFIEDFKKYGNIRFVNYSFYDKKELFKSIMQGDQEQIRQNMKDFKAKLTGNGLILPGHVHFVVMEVISSLARYLSENGFDVDSIFDVNIFSYDFLISFRSIDELVIWVEQLLLSLSGCLSDQVAKKPRRILEEIKEFIIQNISEDIGLSLISQKFYYNASYISRIFKEELNYNFSNYVIEQKINYAKKLMNETNLKLFEICEKVGYKDYKYFTSIFKSVEGVTPSEYKKQRYAAYEI